MMTERMRMPDLTNERAKLSGEMDIGMDSEFFVDLSDAELAGFLNGLDDDAVKVLDMAEVDGCVQQVVNYSVAQGLFHKHSSPAALLEGDEECRGSEPWTCSSSSDDDDDDSDEGKTGGFSVDPIYTMSCSGNESDGTVVEPICGWSDDGCPSKLGFDAPCFSEEMGGDFSLKRLDSADSAETDVGTTYSCTIDDESELYYYVGCDSGTEVYEVDIRSATKKPLCSVEDAVGWQGTSKKGKKGKKGKKPEARKVITKKDSITPDVLRTKFHLSRRQAATELGIGLTYLKKLCRNHAIARWPSRKIQAIDGVVEQLKAIAGDSIVEPFDGGMRVSLVQTKIGELLLLKSRIELDPELPLGIDMNKLIQRTNCQVNGRKKRVKRESKMPKDCAKNSE